MHGQGVWDAIEPADPDEEIETQKDQMAHAAIYQAIGEDTLLLLAEKETAKETWETLRTMHMGAERIKEAKIQTRRFEFEGLRMREAETVDDFAMKLTTIVNKIRALGDKVDETYVIKKILRAVPSKFLHIASTIEQFGNLKKMTMEEVIGSLKAHEERLRGYGDNEDEHVLLTRTAWKTKEEVEGSSNSSKARGDGRGHGHGCGRGRSEEDRGNESNQKEKKFDKTKVKCYNFHHFGHFAYECRSKKKDEKVHLVETQGEDEPALLVIEEIMLHEEKLMPREEVVYDSSVWYLDT